MKSSKILIVLVALAAAGASSFVRAADEIQTPIPTAPDADAAPGGKKGDRPMRGNPREMMKEMKEKLNLTPDQEKQIGEIRKSHMDEFKAARGDHAKMGELLKAQHDEVRAVLTPDQQKTFDTMTPMAGEHHGKKKEAAPAATPTPPPAPPTT